MAKRKPRVLRNSFGEWSAWIERFQQLDDALMVIVAHSYVDDLLGLCLLNRLVTKQRDHAAIFSLTAQKKEQLALWSGPFDQTFVDELSNLRTLRNDCAHGIDPSFSFDTAAVRKRVDSFRVLEGIAPELQSMLTTSRIRFLVVSSCLITTLESIADSPTDIRRIRPMFPGFAGTLWNLLSGTHRQSFRDKDGALRVDPAKWDFVE